MWLFVLFVVFFFLFSSRRRHTRCALVTGVQTCALPIWTPVAHRARDLRRLRREVGMVFQSFNLFPHLDALTNVTLAPRVVGRRRRTEAEQEGMALLDRVGLAGPARKLPADLSGGQQQRVAKTRRTHVLTPVPNAHVGCRLLLEKKY